MLKTASLYAIIAFVLTLGAMPGVYISIPENDSFNGTMLSALQSVLAGFTFTLEPIRKVKKLYPH